jgi:hypothetical protein
VSLCRRLEQRQIADTNKADTLEEEQTLTQQQKEGDDREWQRVTEQVSSAQDKRRSWRKNLKEEGMASALASCVLDDIAAARVRAIQPTSAFPFPSLPSSSYSRFSF